MKKHIKHHGITVAVVLGVLAVGAGAFVYSGVYNIGADDPHTRPVFALLQTLRERSIQARSADLKVPDLNDPQLILKGAGQYAAMCTQCHLTPAMKDSELRPGLYPQPPNLSQVRVDPKEAFWVIKHGIKMSAMPAWGFSHEDPAIWSMVAFLQKLPGMSAQQYKDIVARAPPDEDMDMGDGDAGHGHAHDGDPQPMPAMAMPDEHAHADAHAHGEKQAAAAETPISLEGLRPGAVPAAEAVARQFHQALQRGDRKAVLAQLAPDVSIREGGETQTRDAYAAGHLDADIAFLKQARMTPEAFGSMAMGDTAMVGSETTIAGTAKGRPVTVRSREMLTLRQHDGAWKIAAVQWQSAPAEGAASP